MGKKASVFYLLRSVLLKVPFYWPTSHCFLEKKPCERHLLLFHNFKLFTPRPGGSVVSVSVGWFCWGLTPL